MNEVKSTFSTLAAIDVSKKIKKKNGLAYLSWSSAWNAVKQVCSDATFTIYPQILDDSGNTRFWHDDGRTGWVQVGVTIDGIELIECLAIMDFKNKSIPADTITSVDANKSLKRCLVKACALHGLGLYIYQGEDLPGESAELLETQNRVYELFKKKYGLSDTAKKKALDLCKEAERKYDPALPEEVITGNIKVISDVGILEDLEKRLMAIRK